MPNVPEDDPMFDFFRRFQGAQFLSALSAVTQRLSGVSLARRPIRSSYLSLSMRSIHSPSIQPGATALTRILPEAHNSFAIPRVKVETKPFDDAYNMFCARWDRAVSIHKLSTFVEIDANRKYRLLNGLDDIGLTLRHADKIKAFEAERLLRMPWLATQLP